MQDIGKDVSIAGLDQRDVLAALYNASAPLECGFLQALSGPVRMCREEAAWLTLSGQRGTGDYPVLGDVSADSSPVFDYVYGRPLKVALAADSINSFDYDERNGKGSLVSVIGELRENGLGSPRFDTWRLERLAKNSLMLRSDSKVLHFLAYVQFGREMLYEMGYELPTEVYQFKLRDLLFEFAAHEAMKVFDPFEPHAAVGAYVKLVYSQPQALDSIMSPGLIESIYIAANQGNGPLMRKIMTWPKRYVTA